MDLASYVRLLRRRAWLVVLAVVVTVGVAGIASSLKTKQYTATTRLLVSGSSGVSAIDEVTRRQLAGQRAVAFSQIAGTAPAAQAALEAAGNPPGGAGISAQADGKSPFLTIIVVSSRAATARDVANAVVRVLPKVTTTLEQTPSATKVVLSTLEPAALPSSPSSPKLGKDLGIGLALGLLLGLGAAVARETLDPAVIDGEAIRALVDVPVLGTIPDEHGSDRLLALSRPHSRRAEAYRQVRTSIDLAADQAPRSIVITSPGQGDGKSSLAANLAVAVARSGRRVCLVDADLRRPAVADYLGLDGAKPGLSEVLRGLLPLREALTSGPVEGLTVLLSGAKVANPSELVGAPTMGTLIERLEASYDFVVVDTPPVLAVTDGLLIGVKTSGVVLVIRLGQTTRTGLRRSLEALNHVRASILGVVGNGAADPEDKGYGYGYYSSNEAVNDGPAPALAAPQLADDLLDLPAAISPMATTSPTAAVRPPAVTTAPPAPVAAAAPAPSPPVHAEKEVWEPLPGPTAPVAPSPVSSDGKRGPRPSSLSRLRQRVED